jgi:hypothetical protein
MNVVNEWRKFEVYGKRSGNGTLVWNGSRPKTFGTNERSECDQSSNVGKIVGNVGKIVGNVGKIDGNVNFQSKKLL